MELLKRLWREENGNEFISWLIIALVVAIGALVTFQGIRTSIQTKGNTLQTNINGSW